jgi:hypothetical protein
MPTYSRRKATPTTITAPAFGQVAIQEHDLPGAAAPIPLSEADALLPAADQGWIDVRACRSILAIGAAAGAQATFTAQIKAHQDGPAVALALADGVIAAGAQELLINGDTAAAYMRFLVAGTASPGVNTCDLYIITK